jgi:hypothetical protein
MTTYRRCSTALFLLLDCLAFSGCSTEHSKRSPVAPIAQPAPVDPAANVHHEPPGQARIGFREVEIEAGLNYRWTISGKRPLNILQTIGNGCAFLDYDNDGNQLCHSKQQDLVATVSITSPDNVVRIRHATGRETATLVRQTCWGPHSMPVLFHKRERKIIGAILRSTNELYCVGHLGIPLSACGQYGPTGLQSLPSHSLVRVLSKLPYKS